MSKTMTKEVIKYKRQVRDHFNKKINKKVLIKVVAIVIGYPDKSYKNEAYEKALTNFIADIIKEDKLIKHNKGA